jgi:ferredoxin-NADP reductase
VSIELLKEVLPSNNFEYYLCGSGAFMKSLTDGLEAWGVPDKDVHFEAFGSATVKKKAAVPTPAETTHLAKSHGHLRALRQDRALEAVRRKICWSSPRRRA